METEVGQSIKVDIYGLSVVIRYPASLGQKLHALFPLSNATPNQDSLEALDILEENTGSYKLEYKSILLWERLTWPTLLPILIKEIENLIASRSSDALVCCGAVENNGKAITILGPSGSSKSALTAWLVSRGFHYLADDLVSLATGYSNIFDARNVVSPVRLPLRIHASSEAKDFLPSKRLYTENSVFAAIDLNLTASATSGLLKDCGLIVVPQYDKDVDCALHIAPVPENEVMFLLRQATHPAHRLHSSNVDRFEKFARSVPAISVTFNSFSQLENALDVFVADLTAANLSKSQLNDFCLEWHNRLNGQKSRVQTTTQKPHSSLAQSAAIINRPKPRLSIGMATYDDYDGVYFTLQALRMYHPETVADVEYLVIDNNPDGQCAPALQALQKKIPNYRYVPVRERNGTAVRDYIMAEADSDNVLSIDCHVLLVPGAVARLITYFQENPDTPDLLQGPIIWDELDRISTHMEPSWREGFFGNWADDERGIDPNGAAFEIPMHGLGLYACRRDAWPKYNSHFRGFGGEEGYIHEKFRQSGGRTLCLPFLRWLHRFQRPLGVPYKISWEDRIRNYMIGMMELGLPVKPVNDHFEEYLGSAAKPLIEKIQKDISILQPS